MILTLLTQWLTSADETQFYLYSAIIIGALILLGFLLGQLQKQFKVVSLKAEIEKMQAVHHEKLSTLKQAHDQLSEHFTQLSQAALKDNRESFMSMAQTELAHHIQRQHLASKADLDKREQSIANLVSPIKEALAKTDAQIRSIEKERMSNLGSLKQQLLDLAQTHNALQSETRNLVSALRRPEVRGQWGELTLKRLVELSGMSEHADFSVQSTIKTDEGIQRPDLIVRMPDNRELIVDAKTPLDAYLSAIQASTDTERTAALKHHSSTVKKRVRELAQKKYWDQLDNTPDYVVLFIPGEQFLSAALESDSSLMEYALSQHVILATPTSLVALLRAVAFGWRQHAVAENAEHIQKLGEVLYQRISVFTEHLNKLGANLDKSVEFYNKAISSLERNVLSSARKFTELGIEEKKPLSTLENIDTKTHQKKTD